MSPDHRSAARTPRGRFRQHVVLLAPLVGWCAVVFFLSGGSGSLDSMLRLLPAWLRPWLAERDPVTEVATVTAAGWCVRKLAHLTEYAIMALLAYRWLAVGSRLRMAAVCALAVAFCAAFAAADEYHQSFVPGRTAVATDAFIDAVGAALAVGVRGVRARRAARQQH